MVWATLWSERGAIPTQSVYKVTPEGKLGEEDMSRRVVREAIIREAEVSLLLDVEFARLLRGWLDEKIKIIDAARAKAKTSSVDSGATEEKT